MISSRLRPIALLLLPVLANKPIAAQPPTLTAGLQSDRLAAANAVQDERSDLSRLPWSRRSGDPPRLPFAAPKNVREWFRMYGIEDTAWQQGGQTPSDSQRTNLLKMLMRLPEIPLADLDRWQSPEAVPRDIIQSAVQNPGAVFRVRGEVQQFDEHYLSDADAERFGFRRYFRVSLMLEDGTTRVDLLTRRIPQTWHRDSPRPIQTGGLAILLGRPAAARSEPPLMIIDRLGWYPSQPDPARGIHADHVRLAAAGMNIALWEDVLVRNRRTIGQPDRACLFELLSAVNQIPQATERTTREPFDITPLLVDPSKHQASFHRFEATARRVTLVRISRPQDQQLYGLDHYYQIDGFVKLVGPNISYDAAADPGQSPEFIDRFPVTICARRLPPKLQNQVEQLAGGETTAELINEQILVWGVYFKLWQYRSSYIANFDENQRQLSPMFVVAEPILIERGGGTRAARYGLLIGLVFISGLIATWLGVWWFGRSDRSFSQSVLRRRRGVDALPPPEQWKFDEPQE